MKKAVVSDLKGVALDITVNMVDGVVVFTNVHACRTIEFEGVTFLHIVCPDGSVTRINLNRVVMYDVHEHGKEVECGEFGTNSGRDVNMFDYSDYIYGEEDSDDERADDNGKN